MKKLIDFNREDLSSEELEKGMSDLMNDKFNKELKEKYSRKLKNEYGITPDDHNQQQDSDITSVPAEESSSIKWLLPLLLIGVLSIGAYFMTQTTNKESQPQSTEQLVNQYFASNEIQYIDNNRANEDIDEARAQAVKSFQNEDFVNAANSFNKIKKKNVQDQFFQAYSLFRSQEYEKAAINFANFISNNRSQENYISESRLYQILSIIKLEQFAKAKLLYNNLVEGSYEKKELESIISSLQ